MFLKPSNNTSEIKRELVRLVVRGPGLNQGALALAESSIATLLDRSAAGSCASRVAEELQRQFRTWYGDDTFDTHAINRRRAAMLLAIGELVDLATRRQRGGDLAAKSPFTV